MRYAARRDAAEAGIVEALEAHGVFCYRLDEPVDMLCQHRGRWFVLEIKTPGANRNRKDQLGQRVFCKTFDVPVVSTPAEALAVFGLEFMRAEKSKEAK